MTEPLGELAPEEAPAVEVEHPQTEPFYGRTFRANEDISSWDIMEFYAMLRDAHDDPEGVNPAESLVQLRDFAIGIVHPDEQGAFRTHARKNRASEESLLEFVGFKIEVEAERPTERSSDLSSGPMTIEPKSESSSGAKVSPVTGPALLADRPDLALVVVESRAHEAARKAS